MMKKILLGMMFAMLAAAVNAESPKPVGMNAGFEGLDLDRLSAYRQSLRTQKAGGPTAEEVGDVDSFKKKVTYLGVQQTQTVFLRDPSSSFGCTTLPPEAICVDLPPADLSQTTAVDEFDLAVFELPGKASKSLICFSVTTFTDWFWQNTTGAQELARMTVNTTYQIESDVLSDPSLIDPFSGLPLDGKLSPVGPSGLTTFFEFRSLDAGEFEQKFPRHTRGCTGGLVSLRTLTETYGLTEKQAKDFFKEPITVTFGVRGSVSSVTDASYSYGIRLYGD